MKEAKQSSQLSKNVNLPQLVFYGMGTILGAGIFVVIGEVIGEAGALAPLSYMLAGVVAMTTALSYGELGARIPTAGGPVDYLEKAFGIRKLGSAAGWMLITANTVSAATIVTGFVNYMGVFVDLQEWLITISLILALGTIAIIGIKQSVWFMSVITTIGIATLLAVLVATWDGVIVAPNLVINDFTGTKGLAFTGLFAGTFLATYSFIGFGDMAHTAEEVKKVEKTLPRAITIALCVVFVFYLLISAALVGSSDLEKISTAKAPLVEAVKLQGWPGWPVGIASLFIIVNGALTQIIAASRLLMDLARDRRGAPQFLAQVSVKTQTPVFATITLGSIVLMLAVFVPLKSLAEITSLTILFVFAGVNASLFKLKNSDHPQSAPDIWPVIPATGAIICFAVICVQLWKFIS